MSITANTGERPFITPKQLAERLAISDRNVRRLLADREIPSYRVGGSRRIDPADVDAYLASHRDAAPVRKKRK